MTLLLGAVALAACSSGEENAGQDAENASASSMANDANNPFGAVEMQMHERMMAAVGANASETWVKKMIEHHRGAVEMSQILIDRGGESGFVEMARMTVEKQSREIGELERSLAGGITGGSGEANPFEPVDKSMHDAMMAATGSTLSETWARKMIAHHQGGVDMSEVLIRQGGDPDILAKARSTARDQRAEIAHLAAMLSGEAMPAADAPAASSSARATDRATPAAPRTSPAPKAAQPPAQPKQAAPRPTSSPAPSPTAECLPEHRAAGHC
ncbi:MULTISPECIES: DUF305 domain-containing protein [Bacteria]|nr:MULTISPECIES: DUF305 domain-containing protein [Bacteria]